MNRNATTSDLHADHRHWVSEIAMWQQDFEQWHNQHKNALDELEQIAKLIRQHESSLEEHEQSVGSFFEQVKTHELELAELCKNDPGCTINSEHNDHPDQAERIHGFREAHERIKRHHHEAIAKVSMLKESLAAAM